MGNGERKEEEEEEEVEEDIFRAAPNQLLHQFLSVGVKLRAKERDTHKFNTKNQYAAYSFIESSGQRGRESEQKSRETAGRDNGLALARNVIHSV